MSPMLNDPKRWEDEEMLESIQVAPEEGVRNLTKLILANRIVVWFSFRVPIAYNPDSAKKPTIMTSKKYSTTTNAHMGFIKGTYETTIVDHDEFRSGLMDVLAEGVREAAEAM